MRTIFFFLICALLTCCQKSPSKLDEWRNPTGKVKVLSTTPIIDDLVSRIGGERIDHLSLMDPAIDPHSYELVKGDDEKFRVAQVVFCNGLGLEHSGGLITQLKHHPHVVSIGEEIDTDSVLSENGQLDPHIWLDVSIWKECIGPIVSHLSKADPAGADYYVLRGKETFDALEELDQWIQEKFKTIPSDKKFLVTSHDAFNYFARRYLHENGEWKDRFCAPEGLAPDGQLGFHDLDRVISHLYHHQIQTIFPEANVSKDSLIKIADICKDKKMNCMISPNVLFSDTLSDAESKVLTYEEMMRHNTSVLIESWSAP